MYNIIFVHCTFEFLKLKFFFGRKTRKFLGKQGVGLLSHKVAHQEAFLHFLHGDRNFNLVILRGPL